MEIIFFPISAMLRRRIREVMIYVVIDEPNAESPGEQRACPGSVKADHGGGFPVSRYYYHRGGVRLRKRRPEQASARQNIQTTTQSMRILTIIPDGAYIDENYDPDLDDWADTDTGE